MFAVTQIHLNRAVAVFFVLFTFADLSIPQLCSEEFGLQSLPGGSAPANLGDEAGTTDRDRSHQEQSEESNHSDEDCFCCCSHIVPGSHFSVDISELTSPETNPGDDSLPTSPPNAPYHPPRIS
jgi:hypothetical protein